jgi:hypothetical protein
VRTRTARLAGDIPRDVLPGLANTYLTSEGSRKTERDALNRFLKPKRLTPFHKRLLKLDQLATNPLLHLEMRVKNRPLRPIWQPMARAMWIASQPGIEMNTHAVRQCLEQCDAIIAASIRAGYDPSLLD